MRTINCFLFLVFSLFVLNLGAQTPAQNKQNATHILGAADSGDLTMYSQHVHPNMKHHMSNPSGMSDGKSGMGNGKSGMGDHKMGMGDGKSDFEASKSMITDMHKSFPDSKTTIEKMVAEGDIVMIYSTRTGTNRGDYMGNPATNKPVTIKQFDMIRFDASGKAVEHWSVHDNMSMMQQMGTMQNDKNQNQYQNQNPNQKQDSNPDQKKEKE